MSQSMSENLRTYYYRVNFEEDNIDELTLLFSAMIDKNGQRPTNFEKYEFHELDMHFSDTDNDRTMQYYKRDMYNVDHELYIELANNDADLHYDQSDFVSSIDRTISAMNRNDNRGNSVATIPEDWYLYLYPDGPDDELTGTLDIALVVRVH